MVGMKEYTLKKFQGHPQSLACITGNRSTRSQNINTRVHNNTGVLGVPLRRRGERDLSGDANGGETGAVKNTGRGWVSRPLPGDGSPEG